MLDLVLPLLVISQAGIYTLLLGPNWRELSGGKRIVGIVFLAAWQIAVSGLLAFMFP